MQNVKPGLEVLLEQKLSLVRGCRIGLVTNQSAVTRDLAHAADVLRGAGVALTTLYAPEHGVWGDVPAGEGVSSIVDRRTGIPVQSLYGAARKPTREMLAAADVILFDIQDIGCRFYTYIHTMSGVMQACAEEGKPFIVLDRPNPVNGLAVEGNIPEKEFASFVGLHPIPIRHGMTAGELAMLFNAQFAFGAELEVVACQGWRRAMWFDQTGLPWVPSSPNMPTLDAALLYSGLCFIEGTNVSEGRGTSKPFEMLGAPWVDGHELADRLNAAEPPSARFRPVHFTPTASKYEGQPCRGVQVHVVDRDAVRPVELGLQVVKALHELYPGQFQFLPPDESGRRFFDLLAGTDKLRIAIGSGMPLDEIADLWRDGIMEFMRMRRRYFLYS